MSYTYDWPKASVTADAVVFREEEGNWEVLLIKRKHDPYAGMWALPGGFMDMDETTEQTAHRELEEETSLKNVELKQLHTFDTIGRDPRGRTITVMYYGITSLANSTVQGGDDAEEAKWFNINELPDIAFDHYEPIAMAVERLNLNTIK